MIEITNLIEKDMLYEGQKEMYNSPMQKTQMTWFSLNKTEDPKWQEYSLIKISQILPSFESSKE